MRTLKSCPALLSGILLAVACAASRAAEPGAIVLVGGVLRYDNRLAWQRIVALAGGPGARFAVFPTATGRPRIYGGFAVRALRSHGASAALISISPKAEAIGVDYRRAVRDETLLARVRSADGIFFTGGAPQYIARTLYEPGGAATPMLEAIREVHAGGGVIAGANVGRFVLATGIGAATALRDGLSDQALHPGLGLLPGHWFIDQHYFTHGRFAASLEAMRKLAIKRGIGVGANTALVITGGRRAEVISAGRAMLVDLSQARFHDSGQPFSLRKGRLSYLAKGDSFDLHTLRVNPYDSQAEGFAVASAAADRSSSSVQPSSAVDVFAPAALNGLIFSVVAGERRQGVGLAFAGSPAAFRFLFYAGWDSFAWVSGANDYTATNVYLDVTPLAGPAAVGQ